MRVRRSSRIGRDTTPRPATTASSASSSRISSTLPSRWARITFSCRARSASVSEAKTLALDSASADTKTTFFPRFTTDLPAPGVRLRLVALLLQALAQSLDRPARELLPDGHAVPHEQRLLLDHFLSERRPI